MEPPNHFVALLLPALQHNPDLPVFKGTELGLPSGWGSVTYRQLLRHLSGAITHWKAHLADKGLNPGDVIGVW